MWPDRPKTNALCTSLLCEVVELYSRFKIQIQIQNSKYLFRHDRDVGYTYVSNKDVRMQNSPHLNLSSCVQIKQCGIKQWANIWCAQLMIDWYDQRNAWIASYRCLEHGCVRDLLHPCVIVEWRWISSSLNDWVKSTCFPMSPMSEVYIVQWSSNPFNILVAHYQTLFITIL